MNALRPQTTREMAAVIDEVRRDEAVRCLLRTGAGRGFCAGDDFQAIFLAEDRGRRKIDRQLDRIRYGEPSLDSIFALEKPTIAAVNGPAVGYGMDIALYCDIRYASERAKFGWFFVRRAVMGTIGGTFVLRQLVGLSKAMELTLTGDLVDADEALRIGLVSKVLPDAELLDAARALAHKIAGGPPLAQRAIKRSFHKSFEIPWQSLGEYQQALGDVLWETDDHMEGVRSFMEKRDPVFRGR
jgi:enoyl-CoA hydratase/carnithine racemase